MKKKLPIAPVRAKVRGTCAVHAISIVARAARRDRLRQRDRHHRLIVRVAVVGRDEALARRSDRSADGVVERDRRDVDAAPLVGGARLIAAMPPSARSRMNVDVVSFQAFQYRWNWSSVAGVAGDVAPDDRFGAGDRAGRRVERGRDGVAGVARRERRRDCAGAVSWAVARPATAVSTRMAMNAARRMRRCYTSRRLRRPRDANGPGCNGCNRRGGPSCPPGSSRSRNRLRTRLTRARRRVRDRSQRRRSCARDSRRCEAARGSRPA